MTNKSMKELINENDELKEKVKIITFDFINFFIKDNAQEILASNTMILNTMLDASLIMLVNREKQIVDLENLKHKFQNEKTKLENKEQIVNTIIDKAYFYDMILTAIEVNPSVQSQWINLITMIKLFSDENLNAAISGKKLSPENYTSIYNDTAFETKKLLHEKNILQYQLEMAKNEIARLKNANKI